MGGLFYCFAWFFGRLEGIVMDKTLLKTDQSDCIGGLWLSKLRLAGCCPNKLPIDGVINPKTTTCLIWQSLKIMPVCRSNGKKQSSGFGLAVNKKGVIYTPLACYDDGQFSRWSFHRQWWQSMGFWHRLASRQTGDWSPQPRLDVGGQCVQQLQAPDRCLVWCERIRHAQKAA